MFLVTWMLRDRRVQYEMFLENSDANVSGEPNDLPSLKSFLST